MNRQKWKFAAGVVGILALLVLPRLPAPQRFREQPRIPEQSSVSQVSPPSSSSTPDASAAVSERETASKPREKPEQEREPTPRPVILPFVPQDVPSPEQDLLGFPRGPALEERAVEWIVTNDITAREAESAYNRITRDTEHGVETVVNPRTGRKIVQQFGPAEEEDGNYLLTIAVDGEVIVSSDRYDYFSMNGAGCRWLNDTVLLFRSIFRCSFLYNADNGNLVYFCYPFEQSVPLTDTGDMDTERMPPGINTAGLLDVDIDSASCLYTVFLDIEGETEWKRTIFHYNWSSGVYFAIFDDPFNPPGTDMPVDHLVSANFESDEVFYFSVSNNHNMNSQGEDVGDAYFRVHIPTQKVEKVMAAAADTTYHRTVGDYRIYLRAGQKGEDASSRDVAYQTLLYNWRTGELDLQMDGRLMHVWDDHTFVIVTEEQTHIVDLARRSDYVLENSGLSALYAGKEFVYTGTAIAVRDPVTGEVQQSFLPDADAIRGESGPPPAVEKQAGQFGKEELTWVPADFSSLSSDSVAAFAAVLLESGGEGLDEGVRTGNAYTTHDDYQDVYSAFSITRNYLNSPFCGVPIGVGVVEKLPATEVTAHSDLPVTAVYRMALDIPEGVQQPLEAGKGWWYLKTVIVPYQDMLVVDWLMPEREYAEYLEVQSHEDDISLLLDYMPAAHFLREHQYYASAKEIPEELRGIFLLLTIPGRPVHSGVAQQEMDRWSQIVYGVSPFVPPEGRMILHEGKYYLSEGGGAPYVSNYVFRRAQQGDTAVYYQYQYQTDGTYNFRGFAQQSASRIECGLRDGRMQSFLLLDSKGDDEP